MADNLYLSEEDTREAACNYPPEGFEFVTEVQRGAGRWRASMTSVIKRTEDGALFGIDWARGLTEDCDHEWPEVSTYGTCKWRPMVAKEIVKTAYEYAP
jgi:hypothetical protein